MSETPNETAGARRCPFCAEPIQAEAIKCRWCKSRLQGGLGDPGEWHRGHGERKLAGVCAAVAHNLSVSVTAVRAVFLLLALVHGFGLALYAVLWFVLPEGPGARSAFDRLLDAVRDLLGDGRSQRRSSAPPTHPHDDDEGAADRWSRTRS